MRRLIALAILTVAALSPASAQRPAAPVAAATSARTAPAGRFQLVPTQNNWNLLLLDSSTGQVWQVQFSLTDTVFAGRVAVNNKPFAAPAESHPGRFALVATNNMWTFIVLDQDDGRMWQLQWSTDPEKRGIVQSL